MIIPRIAAGVLVLAAAGFGWQMHELGSDNETQQIVLQFQAGTTPATTYTELLDRAVDLIDGNPNYFVTIEGHTGSRGSDVGNIALSERRARIVMEDLIRNGVEDERIAIVAHGESQPFERPEGISDTQYQRMLGRVVLIIHHHEMEVTQ